MNLIKQLNLNATKPKIFNEDDGGGACGAVGAGSIASNSMPLFASLVKRSIPKHPRVIKYSNSEYRKPKKKKGLGISEAFYVIWEDIATQGAEQTYDTSDAIAKLKSLEDKDSVDYRDTATFGLVDADGGIVRVTVPSDQGENFEQDIQHFLSDQDETEDAPEIAEVLFKLKDRYTIVNVEWPPVEEDQEEGQELEGGVPPEEGMPGAEGAMPGTEGDLPPEEGMPPAGGADTGQVQDLLTQVIDMMKSDAEARKAEAQAREAEAKTKQAGAAREQAMARVKQEEQFLDMDEYQKAQKTKEKEAKRLAQLAKWKHGMDNGEEELPAQEPQYDFLPGEEENEEIFRTPIQKPQQTHKSQIMRGKVTSSDIAKYINQRTS